MNNKDSQYWRSLEQRYFDATATDEEERLLMHFAATTTDPAFRELQAVLGFVCAERQPVKAARRKGQWRTFRRAAAAVLFLGMVGGAAFRIATLTPTSTSPLPEPAVAMNTEPDEDLVAYVAGQRITDEALIIAMVNSTLQEMNEDTDIAEEQLRDMLETLE